MSEIIEAVAGGISDIVTEVENTALHQLEGVLTNDHKVCMKIKNLSRSTLTNGHQISNSGKMHGVVPPAIQSQKVFKLGFQKSDLSMAGAVGVVQYDIGNYSLSIRYSNPYVGRNKGGFLWRNANAPVHDGLYDYIEENGTNFEAAGVMHWWPAPSPDNTLVAKGFISQGNPAFFHIHIS